MKTYVGFALWQVCQNDADDEAYVLSQAAKIIRKEILNKTTQFDDVFPVNCQVDAIPPLMQTVVAMLCHVASITEQSLATQNQALLSICQLIIFIVCLTVANKHQQPGTSCIPRHVSEL